jgi:hypothetical protein
LLIKAAIFLQNPKVEKYPPLNIREQRGLKIIHLANPLFQIIFAPLIVQAVMFRYQLNSNKQNKVWHTM